MRVKIGRQTWRLDGKWSLLSLLLTLVAVAGDMWVSHFDDPADKTYWLPGRGGGSEVGPAEFFYTLLVVLPCCVLLAIVVKKDGWPWLRRPA